MPQGANGARTTKERQVERSNKDRGAVFTGAGGVPDRAGGDEPSGGGGQVQDSNQDDLQPRGDTDPNSSIADRSSLASPYASALSVAGLRQGRVLDVNLQINAYSHACAEDLDVLLVGPSGRNAVAMSDMPGCTNVQNVNLTLDDEGAGSWSAPLVSGTSYVPTDNDVQGLDAFPVPPRAAGPSSPLSTRPSLAGAMHPMRMMPPGGMSYIGWRLIHRVA